MQSGSSSEQDCPAVTSTGSAFGCSSFSVLTVNLIASAATHDFYLLFDKDIVMYKMQLFQ
jgi:hypothetical protein